MAKKFNERIQFDVLTKLTYQLFDLTKRERTFIIIITILFLFCGVLLPYPHIAMWFGFALAGYSAIANDSIQTIGTFIASNTNRKWWALWLFIGLIFVATVTYSWFVYDGDITYQRLSHKGFDTTPTTFSFLQLAAPIFLLIITRLRMPVSTTFLLLNAFSSSSGAILSVLKKSVSGYVLAFICANFIWFLISRFVKKYLSGKPAKYWLPIQWVTSGTLWSFWIMQDAANIAVFLPRNLGPWEFVAFAAYIFLGLGLLFYLRGDRIQEIVTEKSGVADIRAATLVDFVYAILLFYFKIISEIPMSTTWVFIGLLGGRELAISFSKKRKKKRIKSLWKSVALIKKDLIYAATGLIVSLIVAIAANDALRKELFAYFGN